MSDRSTAKLNFLAVNIQILHIPLLQRGKMLFHFALQNCASLVERFAKEANQAFLTTDSMF